MGTLRSATDHSGLVVNGITLGCFVQDTDKDGTPKHNSEHRWDDSRLPNGFIENDGTITIDDMEGI